MLIKTYRFLIIVLNIKISYKQPQNVLSMHMHAINCMFLACLHAVCVTSTSPFGRDRTDCPTVHLFCGRSGCSSSVCTPDASYDLVTHMNTSQEPIHPLRGVGLHILCPAHAALIVCRLLLLPYRQRL